MNWSDIRDWFRYNRTREYREIVRAVLRSRPYTYDSILELEQAKIREMLAFYQKPCKIPEGKREQLLFSLGVALRLLEIIRERTELFKMQANSSSRNWVTAVMWRS